MKRVKITHEFIFKASPTILYTFLTTPACLIRWFCDEVDIQGSEYIFIWGSSSETAELVDDIEEELLRFRWDSAEDYNEFLEFRISLSPVTDETILEIVEFCDQDEVADQRVYWQSLVKSLRLEMGEN